MNRFFTEDELELHTEDRELLTNVRSQMDQWIDKSVEKLMIEMESAVQAGAESLEAQVQEVSEELKATRLGLDKLAETLNKLESDFEVGDGIDLKTAVAQTKSHINAVRQELEMREQRWKGLGKGVVNTAWAAASKAIGV